MDDERPVEGEGMAIDTEGYDVLLANVMAANERLAHIDQKLDNIADHTPRIRQLEHRMLVLGLLSVGAYGKMIGPHIANAAAAMVALVTF